MRRSAGIKLQPRLRTPVFRLRQSYSTAASLLPAPVGHVIATTGTELLTTCAIGQDGPDLGVPACRAGIDEMASIGRPRREVTASGVVGDLDPFLTGDLHHVDILATRCTGAVLTVPGKGDE